MADSKILKTAKKWLKSGHPVLPITPAKKTPTIPNWRKYQKQLMTEAEAESLFAEVGGMAVFCGGPWRIFCLDIDTKYDLTGNLFEDFKKAVPKSILRKMMCQRTQSGGYHLVCKVPATKLVGNEKFASRYTTAYEKDITYREAFKKPDTRDLALKIAMNDKTRVLLESRSGTAEYAGGYFLMDPTPGYSILGGKIQEITESEYDILIETARSFNEVIVEEKIVKDTHYKTLWETTPFEHFNKEGDGLQILYDNGWTKVYSKGKDVHIKRPGNSHTVASAVYDTDTNKFFCYSTSTQFETNKAYMPSSIFIILECEGDTISGYDKLRKNGWGVPLKSK